MLDLKITGVNDPKEYSTTKKENNDDLITDDTHHRKHIITSRKLKLLVQYSIIFGSSTRRKCTVNFAWLL